LVGKNGVYLHRFLKFFAYSQNHSDHHGSTLITEDSMRKLIGFMKNEEGATAIEYGLIASLIAVAIVGVLVTLGPKLSGVFTTVQTNL
jgi:pilus assembly protein Flp/PilA